MKLNNLKSMFFILIVVALFLAFTCVGYSLESETPVSNNVLSDVFEFIKGIFIPSPDYFHNQIQRMQEKVNEKIGGVGYLYSMFKNFFFEMKNSFASSPLTFTISDNYFFSGYKGISLDVLAYAKPYLNLLKGCLNVFVCLITATVCYKRLTALFQS